MNICFVSYWSCPSAQLGILRAGGANVYALNFANKLGELGHKVDIFTPLHGEHGRREELNIHPNVSLIHLHRVSGDRYKDAVLFADLVLDYIKKNSLFYNVIHANYYFSAIAGIVLKKKLSVPLVVTFHTLAVMKKRYADFTDHMRIAAEKNIVRLCDKIVASTQLEKKELVDEYGAESKKIDVVYPGVDHHIFKPYGKKWSRQKLRLPKNKKIILFVGRIDPIKGIRLLIDAIFEIVKNHKEFEKNFRVLLIGGDIKSRHFWNSHEVKNIRYLIGVNDLSCCIKFLGSRPHGILPYYYSASDVVVLPSFYESFGFVVLEAMACARAVVASKVGGLKFLIEDGVNGRLFEANNKNSLSSVLWETVSSEKLGNKLGREGLKYSQKFCWLTQAKKMLSVYNALI